MFKRTPLDWLLLAALLASGVHFIHAAEPTFASPVALRPADGTRPVEFSVVVHPDGRWRGEARLSPRLLSPVSTALAGSGIRHAWEETHDGLAYILHLEGDDPQRIVKTILAAGCASERLVGPVVLTVSGFAQAGDVASIAVPGNPSTGNSWVVDQARFSRLRDETRQASSGPGAPARQTIWFEATGTGQAEIRLIYRRPWENLPPAQVISVRAEGLDLAGTCAALSVAPPSAVPEPQPPGEAQPDAGSYGPLSPQTLPSAFNWCDQGGCTPVKDQASCGSCWAFATVGTLESALKLQQGLTTDLSEQYLLSCNTDGYDCDGGWFAHDYHLDKKPPGEPEAGAVLESAFPYQASSDVPCNGPYSHPYRIASWSYVAGYTIPSVAAIKQAINDHGPVAAGICVGDAFQGYSDGVFQTDESSECDGDVNHAVVLVGWDDSQQAWILRNSWGPDWGESGYMRIRYGTSNVGFSANYIVYTDAPFVATDWVYLPLVVRGSSETASALSNGDFESGRDGSWSEYSSNGWVLILDSSGLPISPHGGNWAAWLGGDADETSILSQRVTIPSDAAVLTYWYWSASEDLCGYDYAYVRFGTSTLNTYSLCGDSATGGWVPQQISVAGWRGQTVELRFVVETDESLNSNFFLDDVSISATARSPGQPASDSASGAAAFSASTPKGSR